MVNIPLSIVVLISLGSFGSGLTCKAKNNDSYFHSSYYNYLIALGGAFIILKEYM